MKIHQKELILIPYPFSDLQNKKVRPALVLSNDLFNKKSDDCILIPLTSIIKDSPYSILITQDNLDEGRLIKTGRIRIDKIFSVDKSLIYMKIGRVNNKTFNKVKEEFFNLV
jgi:mRNA interferase MazF